MLALLDKIAGSGVDGAMMKLSFEQQFLPVMKKSKKWDEEMGEEEFTHQFAVMEKELPAFLHHLRTMKTAPLPSDFGTRN